jgi:hypothetical protein
MTSTTKRVLKIIGTGFIALLILLITISYIYYLEIKKTLVAKISSKSTVFIGQKVDIGDMSFSPSAGINFYNIAVKNPDDFAQGELLKIEQVFLKMKYSELFRGRFHFKDITVYAPELTVMRDEKGRLNLSEKLMQFFKKKPTTKYQIDDFTIRDGVLDFNRDQRFRNDHISLSVKNLSSEQGIKTLIKGTTTYSGENKIGIDGWVYLKDEPKKLNISVSSQGFALSSMKGFLERYGIDTEKTKVSFLLNADGDTGKGFHLKSEMRTKTGWFSFFRKDIKEILLNADAFLNIQDNSLLIDNISLKAGNETAATLKGEIKKIKKEIFYSAMVKISRLDLSVFNFMKDVKISGIITTDTLKVQGSLKKSIPDISGIVHLYNAAVRSNTADIAGINAQVEFLSGKEMAVKTNMTTKVSKVYGYLLKKPADVNIALNVRGSPDNMAVTSSVNITPVEMRMKNDKAVSVNSIAFAADSTIRGKIFAGEGQIELKGVRVADYAIPWIRSRSTITYRGDSISATNSAIEGEGFKVSAERATIKLPGKKTGDKMVVAIKELNASYPERDARISKADLSLRVNKGRKLFSGDFGFSIGETIFSGLHTGIIKGVGRFDNKEFSVDIPNSQIPQGSLKLSVRGRVSEGPFPITILSTAENIEIGNLSKAVSKISGMPYVVSGNVKVAGFEGSIDSLQSANGSAEIQAEKISILNKNNRNILKEGAIKSRIEFRGENLDFRADAKAGKITTDISGTVERFTQPNRSIKMGVIQPEVRLTDIRDAFWDIFPDSILYAGLDGLVSSDVLVHFADGGLKVNGTLKVKDFILQGENGEYSIGPVNGIIPIVYRKTNNPPLPPFSKGGEGGFDNTKETRLPSFERSEFDNLKRYYSREPLEDDYSRITIGSLQYGFKFLDNITIRIRQEGSVLNIGRFSGNIFGGRLNGSAVVDISDEVNYRAGFLLEGISLTKLCEGIEPIKGYISGKVNGIANLKGTGAGISRLIGKADFWTYSTADEKTKISREFLQKVGGPSLKAYLGDRKFDKGIMNLYLQNGFVIFRDLELSNRNLLGMQDLSVKVAPLSNRIAIDHLMWSITEAAQRAQKKN